MVDGEPAQIADATVEEAAAPEEPETAVVEIA